MEAIHSLNRIVTPHATASPEGHQPVLQVVDLSVSYHHHAALEQVSFSLKPGERVAVIGPNGAGKSTLFNVVAGLLSPSRGSVQVYGEQPQSHHCVAYVPQRNQVDWQFPVTVWDVVMMGRAGRIGLFRWPKQHDREMVQEALALVDMHHLAQRQIGELSGGQQQRVFIARALAQESSLILMDEPLNGLDIRSQEDVFSVLDILQTRHVTVMVSTHDLNVAGERFDRLMLLNRTVMAFGLPRDVFQPELLGRAYGGQMQLLQTDHGTMVMGRG